MGLFDDFKFIADLYEGLDDEWARIQEDLGIKRQYAHEGFGFTNAAKAVYNQIPAEDIPYIPGADVVQKISDSQRYWADYTKNTGKNRRYPGLQTHTPNLGDAVNVAKSFDWWL